MHGPPSLPGSEARVESFIPPHPCTLPLSRQGVHADRYYATGVNRGQVTVGGSSRAKGRLRRAVAPPRLSPAPAPVRAGGAGGREGWRTCAPSTGQAWRTACGCHRSHGGMISRIRIWHDAAAYSCPQSSPDSVGTFLLFILAWGTGARWIPWDRSKTSIPWLDEASVARQASRGSDVPR